MVNFVYSSYLIPIVICILLIIFFIFKIEKKYYQWIEHTWFLKRNKLSKIAQVFYFISIALFLLSLLDLRGPEQKMAGETSEQNTILMIDSSLSMLAEDVRPNRFEKAIFIARHFIKNSAGHKISVVVFSDTHKKLVPFTSDRDLLDARISALRDIGVSGGGTGIRQAIQESIGYFSGKDIETASGNIVLLTDAEETDLGFNLKVPESVSLALIGLGTVKGSTIPIRDGSGISRGVKKFKGQAVITKLAENVLKKIVSEVKYAKYWIASSYSLPTNSILSFFEKSMNSRLSEEDIVIKPVLNQYILIPALVFLFLASIIKIKSPYVLSLFLAFLFSFNLKGQEDSEKPKLTKEQLEAQVRINKYLEKWKGKSLSKREKMGLASQYLKLKDATKASNILDKELNSEVTDENKLDFFNSATADLQQKKIKSAAKKLKALKSYLNENQSSDNDELLKKVRENTLLAIKKSKQQKKVDKKKNKDKKKDKDDKKNGSSKNKNKKDDQKGQEDKKNKQSSSGDNKEDKQNDKSKGKPKKKKPRKMTGLLKQLLDEDRNLQKKLLDTSTNKKNKSREKKDW